jgi:two-component system phosphate regulon sensor histidine kinase PhoR
MPMPFSPKLRLAPLWPATAALLVVCLAVYGLLPGVVAEQETHNLEQTLALLLHELTPGSEPARPQADLQARVVALVRGSGFRLTLVARDGTVLADSSRRLDQLPLLDDHAARPEIAAALGHGEGRDVRRSATTGLPTAYAARLVSGAGGAAWVVRLARPLPSLGPLLNRLYGVVGLSALAAALAALAVSWWLRARLFRPLTGLIETAGRIGDGDLRTAVTIPDPSELAALARALERIRGEAERQLAAAQTERDHLRATVASMAEGVLVVDRRSVPRLLNPAFRQAFALAADAPIAAALELAREPRLDDLIADVLARREPAAIEIERAEPVPRTFALIGTPLAGAGGAVVVARDLTEAERLNRVRKDFVANVSHELKTPLAAIRGYAETLVDGAVEEPETALRFSRRILDQCRRLGDLLADLLTLSRLESRRAPRAREPVELHDIAAEAAELVAVAAAARSVALELEPGEPVEIEGDAEGLLRLLSNLLDNAVKYNRAGGTVRVRATAVEGEAVIEVADTGIGIAAAHRDRIFERFYRVDKGRAREEGGTGLGLAIVKHVAQAHGGRVEVESELGRGTTFRVRLPRRP